LQLASGMWEAATKRFSDGTKMYIDKYVFSIKNPYNKLNNFLGK